ncbi:MAG: ureidoglycolate hydrolase [Herbaspirillum sp.]|jgi:ureidoglycolate lyase|nr:ureidoglycolate hydrolase [Herbaspirillum sp.]
MDTRHSESSASVTRRSLLATPITSEAFRLFGDLMPPMEDGVPFGENDATLDLTHGIPRFYVMRLDHRAHSFARITRHTRVTQCLASVGGEPWVIAVAPPYGVNDPDAMPALDDIRAFIVPGNAAIKLHKGTWHAGPFFNSDEMSFFNLELSDTNLIDHHNAYLDRRYGIEFILV